jgi:hypothetical protein
LGAAGAAYLPFSRIIIATNLPGGSIEHCIVHQKANSTALDVPALVVGYGRSELQMVRAGFGTYKINDPARANLPAEGQFTEDGFSELLAGAYADLFLPDRENVWFGDSPQDIVGIPGKYIQGRDGGKFQYASGMPAALALELLGETDPSFFDTLIAARLSIGGLRKFAQHVNDIVPGLYQTLLKTAGDNSAYMQTLHTVRGSLDWLDPRDIEGTVRGTTLRTFVLGKLQAYEQQTGYSFNLPTYVQGRRINLGSIQVNPQDDSDLISRLLRRVTDSFGNQADPPNLS